jgi:MinD superfamily P-loop ATPase
MFNSINDILADIDITEDELRDILYDISTKDLRPSMKLISECLYNFSKCGMCIDSCKLSEYVAINFKILMIMELFTERFNRNT